MNADIHSPPVAVLRLANGSTYELLAVWETYGARRGVYMQPHAHYMPPHHRLCQMLDIDYCLDVYGGELEHTNAGTPAA
jgi:hypothetical protein